METILLHKIATLEIIVETLMDELIIKGVLTEDEFNTKVIERIRESIDDIEPEEEIIDYSKLFYGPIGEA